jgi:Asp/Glu/hydantoin racemase
MPTVAAVYTALNIVDSIKGIFAEILPDVRLINIADDSLIQDVIAAGEVTPAVMRRLVAYYQAAEQAGADLIFNTCSSVGEIAVLGQQFVDVPLVQIDHAMAETAVKSSKIGVLATLPTTLGPTTRLVRAKAAAADRPVNVYEGLAAGAFQALLAGDTDEHDRRIMAAAEELAEDVEIFVLAQASMGRLQDALAQTTGKPVLTSPRLGVLSVARRLERLPSEES